VREGGIPWAALSGLVLGSFMAVLDASIVNVALPRLMAIFGVTPDHIQWVMTAYLLASGAVIPVTGYLADRFGGKRIYLWTLVAFVVGSLLCAFSWSADALIGFRVLQAIGGGALVPVAMSIIFRITPRAHIGTALGVFGLSMAAAPAIGPTLGGYLVEYFDWPLIFLINIPVGFLALLVCSVTLEEQPHDPKLRFDVPGFFLGTTGCVLLLLALSEGQSKGWTSYYIVMLLTASAFLLVLFVLWELITPVPMLDVRLMRNPVFAASLVGGSLSFIGLFAGVYLIPLLTQAVMGYTPMQTGLILMPAALVTGFLGPVAGRLFDRVGALPLGLLGLSILAVTTYELRNVTLDTSFHQLQFLLALRGVGLGLSMMPIATAGMNAVPPQLSAQASAFTNVVRNIAASMGIAYLTHVVMDRQAHHLVWLRESLNLVNPATVGVWQQIQTWFAFHYGTAVGSAAPAAVVSQRVAQVAAVAAIQDAFIVATWLVAAGLPFVLALGKGRMEAARRAELARLHRVGGPAWQGSGPQGPRFEA
jgi:EmrB/QacA subfamily drug resistance transporter